MLSLLPQLFFVLALVGGVGFLIKRQRGQIAAGEQSWANFRLGEIAQRTRLTLVEGDPAFNLMMANAHQDAQPFQPTGGVLGVVTGEGVKETRAVLRGAPSGRPTELSYYHRTNRETNVGVAMLSHTFEFRLSMQVAQPFHPFEIVLREPGQYLGSPPVMSLPPSSFGNPLLDAKLMLFTNDPRIGPGIAAAVVPLASMPFVHVRAHGQSVGAFATQMGSPVLLQHLEQVQYVLDQVAATLDGRQATAPLPLPA